MRGVAGKRVALGSDKHELASPAAHAGFGKFGVVVRHDKFDAKFSFETLLRALDERDGGVHLRARGKELIAVGESPAVILDVSEFDAGGAGRFGESEHGRNFVDVAAMNDEIESDGEAMFSKPFEDAKFLRVGFCAGDFGGGVFASALKAELDVVEAGVDECSEFWFIEGKTGGDDVHVESGGAGVFDEVDDVGAGERFATGEVGLEDAEFGGFGENTRPDSGGEFVYAVAEFEGIGAVDAVERATVSEFGDESERIGEICRHGK